MSADRVMAATGVTAQPRRARTALVLTLAALGAMAVVLPVQLAVVRPALEADLEARASAALRDAGYGGVSVDVAGRDLTAAGTVTQGQAAADVAAALDAVPGVRGVAVRGVQLITAPVPAEDGVITAASELDAVDPRDDGGVVTTSGGTATGAAVTMAAVEGSRLLTSGFANATQTPALPALSFVEGAPTLTAESDGALRAVADQVLADTTGRVFVIRTHTDSAGASAYNQWLSERRAAVVCDGLLALGVPAERLTITGVGESEPLVSPELTEADRATNRRVEIVAVA